MLAACSRTSRRHLLTSSQELREGTLQSKPRSPQLLSHLLLLLKVQVPLLVALLTLDGSVGNALSKRWASLFVVESCGQSEHHEQVPGSFLLPTDRCSGERMSPYTWRLHRGSCIITKCSLSLFGAHQLAGCNGMKVTWQHY